MIQLVRNNPKFVNAPRFGNDISQLESRYPDGCPDNVISKALMISEDELRIEMNRVIVKMRGLMGVEA